VWAPDAVNHVSGRPVFRDQAIGDPKDVDVLHRVRLSRGRGRDQCRALNTDPTVLQRIRRTVRSDPKRAADCYSADDEVVFRDEAINDDYLVRVFHLGPGALFRDETGRPVHGELEAGDGVVWLHPELKRARLASPRSLGGSSSSMAVMVENVDTHFENASRLGQRSSTHRLTNPMAFGNTAPGTAKISSGPS